MVRTYNHNTPEMKAGYHGGLGDIVRLCKERKKKANPSVVK